MLLSFQFLAALTVVTYQSHPELPEIEFFRCEPLRANLTAAGCARNFTSSTAIQCAHCKIGQHHARTMPAQARVSEHARQTLPAKACVRCEDPTYRLIHELWCVSCYNRGREVLSGKNRKGGFPRKIAEKLHSAHIRLNDQGKIKLVQLLLCSGQQEAKRTVERKWPGAELAAYETRPLLSEISNGRVTLPLFQYL